MTSKTYRTVLNLVGVFQLGAAASFAIRGHYGWAAFAAAFGLADFALAARLAPTPSDS